jgi:tetratricopeptide (TPR) repeat protein
VTVWVDSMRIWQLLLRLGVFVPVLLVLAFPGRGQTEDAQSHADAGIQFARSGDLARAADELRRAVMLAPTNAEFLSTLGTVLAMDKKLEESSAAFRKALQFAPQDSTVRRYLAANLWQLHHYPEAKRELQIILHEHPNDAQSRLLLGMVSENSGDYSTAAKMLSSVPDEVEKRPESIAALAHSYYQLREHENARATLQGLSSHAGNAKSLLLGAEIADQAGDYIEAERLLDSISEPGDTSADIRFRKATVQYHAGHFAQCQTTLEPLLAGPGVTAQMYNLLGWCYHRLNKPKEATEAFEHAIALTPADESNYVDLIKVLEAHDFLLVALDAANHAAALFPNSAAVFNLKGSIESRLSQFTDAITSYKHSVEAQSSSSEGWLGLGRAQVSAGLIPDATSTFTSAIERFPNEARLKVVYAEMLRNHVDPTDRTARIRAEQLLKQAIANDATNPEAFFALGKIELDDGRLTHASQHLERAAKLLPESREVHFVLSRVYRRLNRTADAQRELETYQRLKKGRAPERQEGSLIDEAKP